jgi:hypothetical protein
MFKKNFSSVICATIFAAFGLAGCGGGNDGGGGGGVNTDTATTTNTGTPTNTTTDTTTGTPTDTTTGTGTGTAVTIPSWFTVGKQLMGQLINSHGGIDSNFRMTPAKINADGTYTASVVECTGSCYVVSGGDTMTGNISETQFTIVKAISAIGVIPGTDPAGSLTSGTWSQATVSGTFNFFP